MRIDSRDDSPKIEIAHLYPHLTTAQQQEAEEGWKLYLQLALRVYERIRADPTSYQQFKLLTQSEVPSSMHGETAPNSQKAPNPTQS